MPRATRNLDEILKVKDLIFETALRLMEEDGYENLSMRRLAAMVGMTAANIYNYYKNKDEIYLAIQTRGFEMLYERFTAAVQSAGDPYAKLEAIIRAYIEFGVNNSSYHNIMFSWNVPKYSDYVGTELESVAYHEKQMALKNIVITSDVIEELVKTRSLATVSPWHYGIQLWITMHGLVSLISSRVLPEVDEDLELIKEQTVKRLMEPFA